MADLLFAPIRLPNTKPKKLRYQYVQHKIVKTTIIHDGCGDCDTCFEDEEEEIEHVWAIIDAKRGHHNPLGYIYDADQAKNIVDLLNKSGP